MSNTWYVRLNALEKTIDICCLWMGYSFDNIICFELSCVTTSLNSFYDINFDSIQILRIIHILTKESISIHVDHVNQCFLVLDVDALEYLVYGKIVAINQLQVFQHNNIIWIQLRLRDNSINESGYNRCLRCCNINI